MSHFNCRSSRLGLICPFVMQWTAPTRRHLGAKMQCHLMNRECLLLAMNGPSVARNRLPLVPQLPTFWARPGRSEGDPTRTSRAPLTGKAPALRRVARSCGSITPAGLLCGGRRVCAPDIRNASAPALQRHLLRRDRAACAVLPLWRRLPRLNGRVQ